MIGSRPIAVGTIVAGACLVAAGCALTGDPYEQARAAAAGGRLLEARALLGNVTDRKRRQPHLLRLRVDLDRRIDEAHRRVLRGIELLCEGRDDRAVALFESALSVCPDDPYAGQLLETTRARSPAVGEPVAPPPAAPSVETIDLDRSARANALREIELFLQEGFGDRALSRLDQLYASSPNDSEVARRLARVLNQRALMRYGQGKLLQAITYWRRVLELQPDAEDVRRYLQLAEREQHQR